MIPLPLPRLVVLLTIILALSTKSLAYRTNQTTHVNIHIPYSLYRLNGGYQHRVSKYGWTQYQQHGTASLNVHYVDQEDFCEYPLQHHLSGAYPRLDGAAPDPPYMLMTHRGNCTFVQKARHAQWSGAAGLLVADDRCLCSDTDCINDNSTTDKSKQLPCQEEEPYMADDGSGWDVSIPTVLLRKSDGSRIVSTLKENIPVLLDMRWHPPTVESNKKIWFGLWMDPLDNSTRTLLQDLRIVALAFGIDRAQFVPHYVFSNGTRSRCLGNTGQDACFNTCVNNGRYCYPIHHVSGVDVMTEVIHRICLWKHVGEDENAESTFGSGGNAEMWWNYVTYFDQHCFVWDQNQYGSTECRSEAYKYANLDHYAQDEILSCVRDTGGADATTDAPNHLLEEELRTRQEYGVIRAPTVWVHEQTLNSARSISGGTILSALCGATDSPPPVCGACVHSHDPYNYGDMMTCAEAYLPAGSKAKQESGGGHTFQKIFLWILLATMVFGGGYYFYKKRPRQQLADSFEQLRYAMLADQEPHMNNGGGGVGVGVGGMQGMGTSTGI